MHRTFVTTGLALLLATPSLAAQQAEEQTPTQVYVAYYKVSYADLEDWIAVYHEHAVPILQELQDEGVIQGWGVWQHSTGGEYNWRFAVRASDWSQFGQFWEPFASGCVCPDLLAFLEKNTGTLGGRGAPPDGESLVVSSTSAVRAGVRLRTPSGADG